jgi:hypothetical protein
VKFAGFEDRALEDVLGEHRRPSGIDRFFPRADTKFVVAARGTVNEYEASVRGLAFHIAGHELHHLRTLREKYLPKLS